MTAIRALVIVVFPTLIGSTPLFAQARSDQKLIMRVPAGSTEAALRDIVATQAVASDADPGRQVVIDSLNLERPRLRYWVVSRLHADLAELHERWSDVVFVTEGTAILRTGRKLAKGREVASHEWRSASIENPQDEEVHKGDVFVIPAGIAHQYLPVAGTRFTYLTVKVPPAIAQHD